MFAAIRAFFGTVRGKLIAAGAIIAAFATAFLMSGLGQRKITKGGEKLKKEQDKVNEDSHKDEVTVVEGVAKAEGKQEEAQEAVTSIVTTTQPGSNEQVAALVDELDEVSEKRHREAVAAAEAAKAKAKAVPPPPPAKGGKKS